MQLLHAHAEALGHGQCDLGQQRATVGIEQPVKGPPDAVVAEPGGLSGIDAE